MQARLQAHQDWWQRLPDVTRWILFLLTIIICTLPILGSVADAVIYEYWEDDDFLLLDARIYYHLGGKPFADQQDLYWTQKADWKDQNPYYYSPPFAAGAGVLTSVLDELDFCLLIFVGLFAIYIWGTALWFQELREVARVPLLGLIPVAVFAISESYWGNLAGTNIAIWLFTAYALIVWAMRRQNSLVAAVILFTIIATKPHFSLGIGAAILLAGQTNWRFIRNTLLGAVGLYAVAVVLASLWHGPGYIFDLHLDWLRMLTSAADNYPYEPAGESTTNSSFMQFLHTMELEDLSPIVLLLQLALTGLFAFGLIRAITGGLSWASNSTRALAWTLLGYLLAGIWSSVFMDLILLPVLFYFVIGIGRLATQRAQIITWVFFWLVVIIAHFMGYGFFAYMIATFFFCGHILLYLRQPKTA